MKWNWLQKICSIAQFYNVWLRLPQSVKQIEFIFILVMNQENEMKTK